MYIQSKSAVPVEIPRPWVSTRPVRAKKRTSRLGSDLEARHPRTPAELRGRPTFKRLKHVGKASTIPKFIRLEMVIDG